jgi:hypothetical protein
MKNSEVLKSCQYNNTFNIMHPAQLILSWICQAKGYIYIVTSVLAVDSQCCSLTSRYDNCGKDYICCTMTGICATSLLPTLLKANTQQMI